MVKYIGSKRLLVTRILAAAHALTPESHRRGATLADLFSGTARVGHAFKRAGWRVFANDHNAYAYTLARCYVEADAQRVVAAAQRTVHEANSLPPRPGYVTETFCERSRFFHPKNGGRIDAIREWIDRRDFPPDLRAVMLVSLMEAADRVDSTTGLQMAYLKDWAPRALNDLELRVPAVLARPAAGACRAFRRDAIDAAAELTADADLAYVDPPYNQHSYLRNYHIWESLVLWDKPTVYGVACKRADCRERLSAFNSRRGCASAVREMLSRLRSPAVIVSCSNEGFVTPAEITAMLRDARGGGVATVEVDWKRYVGAQIGIYNPKGERVGRVGKLRNREYLVLSHRAMTDARLRQAADEVASIGRGATLASAAA